MMLYKVFPHWLKATKLWKHSKTTSLWLKYSLSSPFVSQSAPHRFPGSRGMSASWCRQSRTPDEIPVAPTRRAAGTLDACQQPAHPRSQWDRCWPRPARRRRGAGYVAEAKFDGARGIARVHGGGVDLISRPGNNFCSRFPDLTESLAQSLGGHSAILDGEVIARDGHGRPNFARLQRRLRVQRPSRTLLSAVPASFCVYLDG